MLWFYCYFRMVSKVYVFHFTETKAILQRKVLIQIEILQIFCFLWHFCLDNRKNAIDFERKISMEIFLVKMWIFFDWPKFCMSNFTFYVWFSVSNSLLCLVNLVILAFVSCLFLFGQCHQLDDLFVLNYIITWWIKIENEIVLIN